ncbi:MAG: polysaccharide deacetylase family protein [Bryobacterales bacterium]|nr:polysaccharide deacetylase family protein [Bryobacterales bacterium]
MSRDTRRLFKDMGLGLLHSVGAFSLAAGSAKRRKRLLILCYHGISLRDEHLWDGNLYITIEYFRRRLALLKSLDANVLPLEEGVTRLYKGDLPPRSVVITFDDGFHDYVHHAVPVLREFGYPCTLYLTTHYCFHRRPVFNLGLGYVLWKSGRTDVDLSALGIPRTMPVRSTLERQAVTQVLLERSGILGMDTVGKDEMIHQIAEQLGVDYPDIVRSRMLQVLTPDEAARVVRPGFDIQLHTHRHKTPANRELFLREIRDNAASIREFTGCTPRHFCYPSGDYRMEFLPWLRECEIKSATTCNRGLSNPKSDPLLLPRLLDDSFVGELDFESYLCGIRS